MRRVLAALQVALGAISICGVLVTFTCVSVFFYMSILRIYAVNWTILVRVCCTAMCSSARTINAMVLLRAQIEVFYAGMSDYLSMDAVSHWRYPSLFSSIPAVNNSILLLLFCSSHR